MRLDQHLTAFSARALIHVRNSPDLAEVVVLLKRTLDETKDFLVNAQDEKLFRCAQGRAQILQELLDVVEKSPQLAEKLSARQGN